MRTTGLILLALAIAVSAAAAPQVVLVKAAQGMVFPAGGPAQNDSFILANAGPGRASINLVPSAPFFTVATPSVTLAAGTSSTIAIAPAVTTAGFYTGFVSVVVSGVPIPLIVPVRMFVGTPPAGKPNPVSPSSQLIIAGTPATPHQGSWNLQNSGTGVAQGIPVSDRPWLVPQGDITTIPRFASVQLPFVSDAKRNAVVQVGALTGKLSYVYLTGTTPASASVSTTVIDINKLPVISAPPVVQAAGETTAFLPFIDDSSDVFFANRGDGPLSPGLRLYYASRMADAGSLPPTAAAWFPFAPATLFNVAGASGTIQVHSSSADDVALAASRSVVPDGTNRYVTALPVLYADRAIVAGDHLVFAGVEKTASTHTDIVLQETAGFDGTYAIDFFDESGGSLATASGSIPALASVTLPDAAPLTARSARVTNTTSGAAARLTGAAMIVEDRTQDGWPIVDSSRDPSPTSDLVVPVPAGLSSTSSFDVWLTNTSASPVVVTIAGVPIPGRSRAVRRGPASNAPGPQSILLAAGETRDLAIADRPYVRISGPAGAVSATGRVISTAAGRNGAFGTSVPAIPSDRASGVHGPAAHFFDSNDAPGVSPPTLLLLEVADKPATVHVTVACNFPAGATGSSHFEAARDFDVAAGQITSVPDLLRSVIGPMRDSLGTLVNVVVDVEVTGGEGRVLSYLQSTEASGDLTLTAN